MSPDVTLHAGMAHRRARHHRWAGWPEERLLETRICDLGLAIAGSPLEPQLAALYHGMQRRGIAFRPHCWLSDCWFSPDGVPGFAIPFYLAHPRLRQLERRWILETEGGNASECQKLMRHETAHALANAYRLHRRQQWRRRFGRAGRTYPESYLPRPDSRRYVIHLEGWYAQSHPHEDWAETFAVWMNPHSDWRERYRGWPALRKLEYVDELMREIGPHHPPVRNRTQIDSLSSLRLTLHQYFEQKQQRLSVGVPHFHRQQLERIFPATKARRTVPAARFIRRHRRAALAAVSLWTGTPRYRVHLTLEHMAQLADELELQASPGRDCPQQPLISALIMLYMGSLHAGSSRLTL